MHLKTGSLLALARARGAGGSPSTTSRLCQLCARTSGIPPRARCQVRAVAPAPATDLQAASEVHGHDSGIAARSVHGCLIISASSATAGATTLQPLVSVPPRFNRLPMQQPSHTCRLTGYMYLNAGARLRSIDADGIHCPCSGSQQTPLVRRTLKCRH